MIFFSLCLVLLGIMLGRCLRVAVLMPATLFVWLVAAELAQRDSLPFFQAALLALFAGACLQFGYFAGGLFLGHRGLQARKPVCLIVRR